MSTGRKKHMLALKILLLGAVTAIALSGLVIALLFWTPAAYQAPPPPEQARLEEALSMEQKIQAALSARLSRRPVELEISSEELDGYVAALVNDRLWDQLRIQDEEQRRLAKALERVGDLRIRLEGSRVVAMGTVPGKESLVVTLYLKPERDAQSVSLRVTGAKIGRLPVPTSVAARIYPKLLDLSFPQSREWQITHIGIVGGRLYIHAGPGN